MSVINVELKYVKEAGHYVVGEDDGGNPRWFDKRKHSELRVDGVKLFVTVSAKEWGKRLKTEIEKKPQPTIHQRKCLCCKAPFRGERFIFVCTPCKQSPDWKDGVHQFTSL